MPDKDVTSEARCGDIDGEVMELRQCVCGATFDCWDAILNIYCDLAWRCPSCGRRLYFRYKVTVLEVIE